jgi:hypothetical protein
MGVKKEAWAEAVPRWSILSFAVFLMSQSLTGQFRLLSVISQGHS